MAPRVPDRNAVHAGARALAVAESLPAALHLGIADPHTFTAPALDVFMPH